MKDIDKAKELLKDDITCVCVKGNIIYTSKLTGIRPVMNFINEGIDLRGFSVADKIVGKAASSLFVVAGIKEVYTPVISKEGLEMLRKYHIDAEYELEIEKIINRKGDDICPMEKTLLGVFDPYVAFDLLKEKLAQMSKI